MSTKTESLAVTRESVETRRQQILDALFMKPPMSRAEIAQATGMRLSSVCGRVNEMIADGCLVVAGTTFDKTTNRNVEAVRLA